MTANKDRLALSKERLKNAFEALEYGIRQLKQKHSDKNLETENSYLKAEIKNLELIFIKALGKINNKVLELKTPNK